MTHYFKNINLDERKECLTKADVVMYNQMFEQDIPINEIAEDVL